jgi:hypothetical protein
MLPVKYLQNCFGNAWKFVGRHKHMPLVCDYDTAEDDHRFRMGLDKWLIMDNAPDDIKFENIQKKIN